MRWMLGSLALFAGIGVAHAEPLGAGEIVLHIESVGTAEPDAARVSISIAGSGQDEAAARAALDAARKRVMAQLARAGVVAGAVEPGEIALSQDYGIEATIAAAPSGNAAADAAADAAAAAAAAVDDAHDTPARRASQNLLVTVTDLARLDEVEAANEPDPNGDGVTYRRSRAVYFAADPKAAFGRSVQRALANARAEADIYAAALGYRIVRMTRVSSAKPSLNLPDIVAMIGRLDGRSGPERAEMAKLAGSVSAAAQVDFVIAPK
jgi:uncharacterized protein YggE